MTTAREIMTTEIDVLSGADTALSAAQSMARLDVGSLPICSDDQRLVGVLTDRDIVLGIVAAGEDAGSVAVGDLAQGEVVTIGADDPLEEVRRTMATHQVRRLPVIDGDRLVGMVSLADLAQAADGSVTGHTVEDVSR